MVEENLFNPPPIVEEKTEERPKAHSRYQPTSLQTVSDKPTFLTARPKEKPLVSHPLLIQNLWIYTGIGLAIVGMILAAVFIFTGIDFDDSWSKDQNSYLSAFGVAIPTIFCCYRSKNILIALQKMPLMKLLSEIA
ncbi:hypothetical protein D5R40_33940 [Okeania hirsuta]|uniref:Uncharacterized protein n=1 Tax=Okeania hirsuta TaxID=1458930 RepID=A0A3N6NLD2_9CYAN|nr:hypothetical protein [Okeania hirsuta]RQH16594.1 hypothetical protein D5R40_33940 [Okeania hirsuta]